MSVPFAPPPKFGAEVLGEAEYNIQLQAHVAWLNSERSNSDTADSGGDDSGLTQGEASVETNAPDSGQDKLETTRYDVFAMRAESSKRKTKILSNVQASSPEEAISIAKQDSMKSAYGDHSHEARQIDGTGEADGATAKESEEKAIGGTKANKPAQADSDQEPESESDGNGESEAPQAPQADDIMLHRLQAAPLIGQDAEAKIAEIATGALAEALSAIQDAAEGTTPEAVEKAVAEAVAKIIPPAQKIVISNPDNDLPDTTIEGEHTHPLFGESLRIMAMREPVYLYGPSGTGKTHMAEQLAGALFPDLDPEVRFYGLSATMGMSESHLQGWRLPLSAGEFTYVPSEFVKRYENGGVFLLDEVDRADPNVLAVLNQALANGRMPLPARFENPVARMHKDFVIICAGNTAGTGADRLYTAATRLDEAFLDRFRPGTMFMDYDTNLELALVGNTKLLRAMWYLRKRCTDLRIERVISTRAIVKLHKLFDGTSPAGTKQALGRLQGTWDKTETSKINITEALAA